jgi:cystathionine beta-lyase
MENFNFDKVTDRRNTGSLKYDFAVERGRPADVLPLWVADMDFPAPACVRDALQKSLDHGIFGYSETKKDYSDAVIGWFTRHFNWTPDEKWLIKTPGVVFALAMAVKATTQPGDSVLIQPPVYYPFFEVVRDNDRNLVENELIYADGHYTIDFADFEEKIIKNNVKLFILCSPHNPVGRVWTFEELRKMGEICQKHGVTVVSDEIHCDFAFPGHEHTPFLKACPELSENVIICTAPSKSFNIAGLQVSNIFIPGDSLRAGFKKEIDRSGYSQLNALGLVACKAAYEGEEEWLSAVRKYMLENLSFLRNYLLENIPQLHLVEPDGTYFAWIDCSELGFSWQVLDSFIMNDAKLWLDGGHVFGENSGQFQRIVLACPRETLKNALDQLSEAVKCLNNN